MMILEKEEHQEELVPRLQAMLLRKDGQLLVQHSMKNGI